MRTYPANVDFTGDRRAREDDVQPDRQGATPARVQPRPHVPVGQQQVEAVRPARERDRAGRDRRSPARRTTRRAARRRSWPIPDCTAQQVPALGRRLRRRRLEDRQRARSEPGLEADEPGGSRPELGRRRSTLDPTDKQRTTRSTSAPARPNRCSSGCEAGVGIYKSTDGGEHWKKLADTCVNNATYACVDARARTPSSAAAISSIVVDPTQHEPHPRRLGAGRPRPLARDRRRRHDPRSSRARTSPGSTSRRTAATTFTEVWNGNKPDPARSRSASPTSGSTRSTRTTVYVAGVRRGRLAA